MNQEKIASMIKEIRKQNNLTQQEFAKIFNVTFQAVSKWENGKNIPDISVLTEICHRYNYDINDFLKGKQKTNKLPKKWLVSGTLLIGLVLILILILIFHKDTFQFKTLSSNCGSFKITGSMAYNKEKTSIYISDVSYCGEKEENKYKEIRCALFEETDSKKTKIEECPVKIDKETSLDDYLKEVKFQIDDYAKTCKNYSSNTLYLEIEAKDEKEEITTYKIPLKLDDNCKE